MGGGTTVVVLETRSVGRMGPIVVVPEKKKKLWITKKEEEEYWHIDAKSLLNFQETRDFLQAYCNKQYCAVQ